MTKENVYSPRGVRFCNNHKTRQVIVNGYITVILLCSYAINDFDQISRLVTWTVGNPTRIWLTLKYFWIWPINLAKMTYFNSSNLKVSAENKIKSDTNLQNFSERIENVGKEARCWLSAFSPLPTMLTEAFFLYVVNFCGKNVIPSYWSTNN